MAELIKSYLPVRVQVSDENSNEYSTFMYIKEQSAGKNEKSNNLFVCNAITLRSFLPNNTKMSVADYQSFDRFLLNYVFNKFGDVQKVTCAAAPGQNQSDDVSFESMKTISSFYAPKRLPFAHVSFKSYKDVKKVMTRASQGTLKLSRLECSEIYDQWKDTQDNDSSSKSNDESNGNNQVKSLNGITAMIQAYKSRIPDRIKLSDQCDEIMARFEASEEAERQAMLNSAEPDDDGFITVTRDSNLVGRKRNFQEAGDDSEVIGGDDHKSKRKGSKRSRKKKEGRGTSELKDFYRFQTRESKRKEVIDLRKRFEEDLQAVKRMKEQKQFKPLA